MVGFDQLTLKASAAILITKLLAARIGFPIAGDAVYFQTAIVWENKEPSTSHLDAIAHCSGVSKAAHHRSSRNVYNPALVSISVYTINANHVALDLANDRRIDVARIHRID